MTAPLARSPLAPRHLVMAILAAATCYSTAQAAAGATSAIGLEEYRRHRPKTHRNFAKHTGGRRGGGR
jgi:hypothetical protein